MERLFDAEYVDGRPKAPAFRRGNNKGIAVIRYADDVVITAPTREVLETYARPQYLRRLNGVDSMVNPPQCSHFGHHLLNKIGIGRFRKQF
jgi:hypothetical protein